MAICLQIATGTRNRPEGGMPAIESYARICEVESDPCPARRSRGKRALLFWHGIGVFAGGRPYGRADGFLVIGGMELTPPTSCVRCRANLGPWRGYSCGQIGLARINRVSVSVLHSVTATMFVLPG